MDFSSMIGGSAPKDSKQSIEYTAQAASSIISGESKLTIGERGLTMTTLLCTVEVPFAEVNELKLEDYTVYIKADSGNYALSRMGNWCQPFYDALYNAYNDAVLRSLFIDNAPILTAKGDYRYNEQSVNSAGFAPIHVYENNVTTLPPDLSARRVPLCFVNGMDKGSFELTLKLDTGESYTYAKLGYETAPFAAAVDRQIRMLREKTLAAVKCIDPTLTAIQASQLAGLMPLGAATPIMRIAGITPSFVAALEKKIAATRANESYLAFKQLCDPSLIWVGFRENDQVKQENGNTKSDGMTAASLVSHLSELDTLSPAQDDDETVDPYMMWMIAPSPDGKQAAVEFAVADSATFIYRTGGDFIAFARQLNRALEAISFRREVIRLSDAELLKPDNADYYMAVKRTSALQFVRMNYAGRVIHSSVESWKRKLTEYWNGN